MGQFSMEISGHAGSVLSGNQHPVVWETLEPPSRSRILPKNKRHLPNKGYRDDVAGDFTSNPTSGYSALPSTARVANSETGENS